MIVRSIALPAVAALVLPVVVATVAACRGARTPDGATKGRLAPEMIQSVVRSQYGKFRACYENGLKTNALLEGRVSTRFVIDSDGTVSEATDAGSEISDLKVRDCVVALYPKMKFPSPEGGKVTVVYPIMFSPGDDPPPTGDRPASSAR